MSQESPTIDTTHNDIVDVISELNARGHVCDINAIEAGLAYNWTDLVNILKEMCSLKVLEYYKGEFFVIPTSQEI